MNKMKKLIALMGLLLATPCLWAATADEWEGTYTGRLYVNMLNSVTDSVQGSFSPVTVSVLVSRNEGGTLDFSLQNLVLRDADTGDEMAVGSVNVTGLAAADTIETMQNVVLQPGNRPDVSLWMADMINLACEGSVPVELEATAENTNLVMNMNINLTKAMGYKVKCRFVALCYQMPNSDFELSWTRNPYPSMSGGKVEMTPAGWHSFFDAEGTLSAMNYLSGTLKQVEGYDGTGYGVGVVSQSAIFVVANGNMTNGCINMGNMAAANAANHDFSKISDPDKSTPFAGLPDSLSVMVNFKPQASGKGNASFTATLHGAYNYTEPAAGMPADSATAYKIAAARSSIAQTSGWTRVSVPFDYVEGAVAAHPDRYMLMTFASNETPGGGSVNDELDVDHIRFIYNSRLAALTIGGEAMEGFSPDSLSYTVDAAYDSAAVVATPDGVGATVERTYNDSTGVLTLSVRGNDYLRNAGNVHTYTIAFAHTATDAMDHNGDGQVNLPDAVVVIDRVVAGDNSDLKLYDHNGDGEINLPDAVMIINRVASGR